MYVLLYSSLPACICGWLFHPTTTACPAGGTGLTGALLLGGACDATWWGASPHHWLLPLAGGSLTQGVPSAVASPLPTHSHQRQLVDFETRFLSKFTCSPAQIPKPGFVATELKALSGFLARSLALLLQAGNKAAIILCLGRKGRTPSSCHPKSQTNHHQHTLQQQYESH